MMLRRRWTTLFVSAFTTVALLMPLTVMAEEAAPEVLGTNFEDHLDKKDTDRFYSSNGWGNGGTFLNGWRDDHVVFEDGKLKLLLDDKPCVEDQALCSGQPYASGEYATTQRYGYGKFEARLKAVKGEGVVTGFFTYGTDPDGTAHEIDVEILGKDTTKLETNYFTKSVGMHSTVIPLGFDAADDFHDYAFEWSPDYIKWYVDGKLVHTETGERGALPSTPGHIIANVWPATKTNGWAGDYVHQGETLVAEFDRIAYTKAEQPQGEVQSVELQVEDPNKPLIYRIGQTEMAPLRYLAESLNAKVEWNGATQEIRVIDEAVGVTLSFKAGSKSATVNGNKFTLAEPVTIRNGIAYVPLTALADAIGAKVERDAQNQLIKISRSIA